MYLNALKKQRFLKIQNIKLLVKLLIISVLKFAQTNGLQTKILRNVSDLLTAQTTLGQIICQNIVSLDALPNLSILGLTKLKNACRNVLMFPMLQLVYLGII